MTRADTFDDKAARCDQAKAELSEYRKHLNDELKAMMMDCMNVGVQVETTKELRVEQSAIVLMGGRKRCEDWGWKMKDGYQWMVDHIADEKLEARAAQAENDSDDLRAEVRQLQERLHLHEVAADRFSRVLEERDTRIAELEKLAYIGEHHFPDNTYRVRMEEALVECDALRAKAERYHRALTTIERSGVAGATIKALRADDHSCEWCGGKISPCPVVVARVALTEENQ